MNILIPRFSMKPYLNALWARVRGTWVAPYLGSRCQVLSALHLARQFPQGDFVGRMFARAWYGPALRGAQSGWESRYPLPYDPGATITLVTTGTNSVDFIVPDWITVAMIGHGWVVAGTVTAVVIDFDYYTAMTDGAGTVTDKLDATNGVLTAPTVAGQAIGNVLYKDLWNTLQIDLNPGSIRANVTTTTTAGEGVPFVLVVPRAEVPGNLSRMIASS